jgi:hypothetical protein
VDDNEIKWLIALVIAAAAVAAAWFFWDGREPPAEHVPVREEAAAIEPVPTEPVHPVEPLDAAPGEGELVELPPLEESDRYFALELSEIFGSELESLLADEALIDKSVAAVDNLVQSRVAEKIRPVGRLSGSFVVTAAGDNGQFYLSPENYGRYTALVDMVTGADVDKLVTAYRRFYPLLQEAYTQLGYPDAYFNDRAVAVIDHLLATPEPGEPVRLVQPHVLYLFADPELEALSAGQKLLIRMGPDHAARVKEFLAELRARIAQPAP